MGLWGDCSICGYDGAKMNKCIYCNANVCRGCEDDHVCEGDE